MMKTTYKPAPGLYPRHGVVRSDKTLWLDLFAIAIGIFDVVMFVRWWLI